MTPRGTARTRLSLLRHSLRSHLRNDSRVPVPYCHVTNTLLRGPVESGQYTAVLFGKRCTNAGIEISMGSVGDCYDNAVCETFHATLKKERIYRQSWPTRAEARTAIFEFIEGWYNPRRRHSTLAYLSPTEFERQHAQDAQRALNAPISANGSVALIAPRVSRGLTTRRISTVGVDLGAESSIATHDAPHLPKPLAQAAPQAGQR
jgi:putative transposase